MTTREPHPRDDESREHRKDSVIPRSARLGLCLVAALVAARPVVGQGDPLLASRVDAWFGEAQRLAPGQWGIAIADAKGNLLWSHNPTESMIPASTVKLLTTGFARTVLGGNATLPTRVIGTGRVHPGNGEWVGPWSLEMNGDVTLERLPGTGPTFRDLAAQLKAKGITRLRGPLAITAEHGPADATYPAVWSPKHRGRYFAPLIGPVMLHENLVVVTVAPASKVGGRAVLIGASPRGIASMISVKAVTRKGRRARLGLAPTKNGGWVVTGTIGTRAGPRGVLATMRDPKAVVEAVWAQALADEGIAWTPSSTVPRPPAGSEQEILAEVRSASFDSVAAEVNRRSLNPGAELMLQWAGGRNEAAVRLTEHVNAVTGIAGGAYLVDGSGLSYEDRVTPYTFVTYLSRFPQTPAGRDFPFLLPANGSGTLRHLRAGFPSSGVVRAKTGTLAQAANVVGYLGRPNGVLLVALLYNGPRVWAARQAEWRLFRLLGADGIVVPADTVPVDNGQLGGESDTAEPATENNQ
jgi:D-alanyl-D-alanine carboxypeptidase/D-alanyl-D-alanine-endopeptidase (penicillin-binding protein 4)